MNKTESGSALLALPSGACGIRLWVRWNFNQHWKIQESETSEGCAADFPTISCRVPERQRWVKISVGQLK